MWHAHRLPLASMAKTRTVDNSNRPARPEPGEDPAVQIPPVREEARRPQQKKSERSR